MNRGRVRAALHRLSLPDLEALKLAHDAGRWVSGDAPAGLTEEGQAVYGWVRAMNAVTARQVWPLPPTGAPDMLEDRAAKEGGNAARVAFLALAAVARVLLEEGKL